MNFRFWIEKFQPIHRHESQFNQNKLVNDWHIRQNCSNWLYWNSFCNLLFQWMWLCVCSFFFGFWSDAVTAKKNIYLYIIYSLEVWWIDGWMDKCKINHIRQRGGMGYFSLSLKPISIKKCLENQCFFFSQWLFRLLKIQFSIRNFRDSY